MHRERLHSLTDEELARIAKEQNIANLETFDRVMLIEEIYAVLTDPFYEQNVSVQLLGKRYEFVDEFVIHTDAVVMDVGVEEPHGQHLYIAVHSPQWLFVDWHVGDQLANEVKHHSTFQALYLRLYALTKESIGYELREFMDIEIENFNGRQYLTLPAMRAHYKVILVADLLDRERVLAESAVSFAVGIG